MNKTLRGAVGAMVASASLLALVALPAGATAFKVDAYMANDLKLKYQLPNQLQMGGSSFDANLVLSAQQQWNEDNPKGAPFATYATSKSGTGRAGAISGDLNIGFSDFPLNISGKDVGPGSSDPSETTANYVQVPVALGGVAIIYNLGNISSTLKKDIKTDGLILNGKTLGQIFAGKITNWDNAAITKLNPKLASKGKTLLPNQTIAVESRTSGSGTTFMFQDYLGKVDAADFPVPSSNAFTAAAGTAANSAALDQNVSNTAGGIGYVEYGYAISNGNPTVSLVNASGKTVKLSEAGILADATVGLAKLGTKFSTAAEADFSINNEVGATNYPIAGFSYAIVKKVQPTNSSVLSGSVTVGYENAVAVVKFLDFLSHQGPGTSNLTTFGQNEANNAGYVALPVSMQAIARKLLLGVTYKGAVVLGTKN